MNYYNEFDPKAAAWLRELIRQGHIPAGVVDERSIADVKPEDFYEYSQCHFFAGIGGWAYALRLTGWPDDRPVWTGSCPCQPFSAAGKQLGTADKRHLWPVFHRLIAQCRPPVVFGEQVASKLGREWLAGVRADLEGLGYAVGAADLCAAGVGAPHIRQRLYWVANSEGCGDGISARDSQVGELQTGDDADRCGDPIRVEHAEGDGREQRRSEPSRRCTVGGCGVGGLGDAEGQGRSRVVAQRKEGVGERARAGGDCATGRLGDTDDARSQGYRQPSELNGQSGRQAKERHDTSPSLWSRDSTIPCGDGKSRRIEPGLAPLAHGIPGRVGLLRGYGNAIVPQVAAEFVGAYLNGLGGSPLASEDLL